MNLLFIIAFIIIIILFYKYLYLYSSEDEYHKHIHEDVDDLNESPIAKFKFHNKKFYLLSFQFFSLDLCVIFQTFQQYYNRYYITFYCQFLTF